MDVLALFGWRTCRETPFKNSFSSASLPTRRSRAAMRASYSASTSAAAVSLSSPPASNLATQILIRLRPIPWRLARACSDSPPRNSWTTWRLNSIECMRCLAMGFLLESPVQLADSHLPHLSTPRGALQVVASATRSEVLPDVPTVGDFVPGYEGTGWQGVGAPRNTPAEIIDQLNKEINAGLADPRMKARIADFGYTVFASSPADFRTFIAAYTEKWAKVIKFSGAKIY